MADHLDSEDYKLLHEIREQKRALLKELKDNYDIDYYYTTWEDEISRTTPSASECLNALYEITHPTKKPCQGKQTKKGGKRNANKQRARHNTNHNIYVVGY